jgi:hypothetical protein
MLEDPARHRGVLYFAGLPVRAELGVSDGLPQAREDILRPELIQKPRSREHRVCLDPGA